jgi:hypothetical protein
MTLELVTYAALIALMVSLVTLWAVNRVRSDQVRVINNLFERIHYIEIVMSHYEMTPLPWEAEDPNIPEPEINNFKQKGNVVYLQEE